MKTIAKVQEELAAKKTEWETTASTFTGENVDAVTMKMMHETHVGYLNMILKTPTIKPDEDMGEIIALSIAFFSIKMAEEVEILDHAAKLTLDLVGRYPPDHIEFVNIVKGHGAWLSKLGIDLASTLGKDCTECPKRFNCVVYNKN